MKAVLFVCIPNPGRSQRAEACFNQLAKGKAMGCGMAGVCPITFGVTEDWGLEGLQGKPLEKVREIKVRVEKMLVEAGI